MAFQNNLFVLSGSAACLSIGTDLTSCSSPDWRMHRAPIPEEDPLDPLPGEEPNPDEEEPPPHPDPLVAVANLNKHPASSIRATGGYGS